MSVMKTVLGALLALALLLFVLRAWAAPRQLLQQAQVTVIHVDDGDTVVVRTAAGENLRVRLASIDAPEIGKRGQPSQPWAQQARQRLASLVLGREITLRCVDLDRYDRQVCDLLLPGGGTANQLLAREGLAWANRASARFLRDPVVAHAERQAQAERRGVWSDPGPVPPWEWRHR